MEIVLLIGILLLIWYYGASIKGAIEEANNQIASDQQSISNSIERLYGILERHLPEINDSLSRIAHEIDDIGLEWKSAEIHTFSPTLGKLDQMLEKLDQISGLSLELDALSAQLLAISISVDTIAAHPEFTHHPGKQLED